MSNSSPLESIFFAALGKQSSAERVALLDEACAGNDELRGRVERMLTAQAEVGNFLEIPASPPDVTSDHPLREGPSSVIGPYMLLEQIGEGGMGVVFMAEQIQPVQRRVALKIIKAGMDTRQVVARFEAERQALAMMDHPNIARVLDAGATDTGRPYFVMELVRGVPMTDFCNQKNLSIRDRLELFVTVCQAVQHAHQKGIIHRDLKPTNVLVTLHDGRPVIKVIDFGVAKATGQKLTDKTLFTGFTQMIGTPLYMSPEQAEMTSQDIDTRSDIFSVGVLLYELLTGTTPFDSQRLKSASFDELRRIIREEEPLRPSTRLTTLALEAASTVGTQRKSDSRQLTRLFRGELDWIVMKCLEKDRTRRYETASALAADVERYLHDEPVQACPPSARYRFGKFARRNKAALLTAAVVIVALVLGTVVSTWQAIRAFNSEAQASTSEQQAKAALEFLTSIIRSPDPGRDQRTITVVEVLDRSVKELQSKFADDPITKVTLLEALAESYSSLGQSREMVSLLEQARDFCVGALGREHPKTLDAMTKLAEAYRSFHRPNDAIPLFEELLRLHKAKLGPDHPDTLALMASLARAYCEADRPSDALPLAEETLKLRKAKLGPEHPDTFRSMNGLARAYQAAGRIDEAIRLREETLKLQKAKLGPDHDDTLDSMYGLAQASYYVGREKDTLPLAEETVKLFKAKYGPKHPLTLNAMNVLAINYQTRGRLSESIALHEETLKLNKAVRGPDAMQTFYSMMNLAQAYEGAGRFDDAIRLNEETLKLMKAKVGPDQLYTFGTIQNLACAYLDAGRTDDAIRLHEETLKLLRGQLGSEHRDTLEIMSRLAFDYRAAGRIDEALRLGEETLKLMKARMGPEHRVTLWTMLDLAFVYRAAGRIDEAIRLGEELLRIQKAALGPEDYGTLWAMHNLAETYVRANRLVEAESLARECLEKREKKIPDDWPTFDTRSLLGGASLGQKKYAEAEPLLVAGYEGLRDRIAKVPAFDKPRLKDAIQRLVQLYVATSQPEKAADWKAKLTEFDKAAIKVNAAVLKKDIPSTKTTESAKEPGPRSPAPQD